MRYVISILVLLMATPVMAQRVDMASQSTGDVAYTQQGKDPVFEIPSWGKRLVIDQCLATNNSGSAVNAGCARRRGNAGWKAYQIDVSESPDAIDITTAAQNATAGDITLFTTTINDGHMVCADQKFGGLGVTVSTGDGVSGVYALSYYNGSSMAALTPVDTFANYNPAGDFIHVWSPPLDWATGTTAAVGGPSDKYCLRVIASTAPSGNVLGSIMWPLQFDKYQRSIVDGQTMALTFEPGLMLGVGDEYLCYFATAHASNTCAITGRVR